MSPRANSRRDAVRKVVLSGVEKWPVPAQPAAFGTLRQPARATDAAAEADAAGRVRDCAAGLDYIGLSTALPIQKGP